MTVRDELNQIDRLIHEPARLALMTALSACKSADFLYLQRLIGLTPGNLSSHLSKLEEAGLVWVDKQILNKRSHTRVGLTDGGRKAIDSHWQQLKTLHEEAVNSVAADDRGE